MSFFPVVECIVLGNDSSVIEGSGFGFSGGVDNFQSLDWPALWWRRSVIGSLRLGEIPEEWKVAVVIPLHKGGKKPSKDPLSYHDRPNSLTPCVARVLEKAQIRKYLEVISFMIISLVFYCGTPQLPNCAT